MTLGRPTPSPVAITYGDHHACRTIDKMRFINSYSRPIHSSLKIVLDDDADAAAAFNLV